MLYEFGDGYVFDSAAAELRRGSHSVDVEPQVFDVLAYLLGHRERLVTKEELLDEVWGDRFVSESALTSRVKSARRAVGDDGKRQGVIRTVHGRGYRWVADTRRVDESSDLSTQEPDNAVAETGTAAMAPSTAVGERTDWPLIGRHREVEAIAHSFATRSSNGVLVTGRQGMGKTRLAQQVARIARESGVPTLRAAGHPEARAVPLACLAHILPAGALTAVGSDTDLSRSRLFQQAIDAIAEMAGDDRVLLLVDDVDLADELSLAVISSLAHGGRAFLVATQQVDSGEEPVLSHLVSSDAIDHVELGPLSADVLDIVLYRVLGGPLEPRSVASLVEASEGVPGLCRQLLEAAIAQGSLRQVDGAWRLVGSLPAAPGLGAMARQRIAQLDPDVRAAADLLSLSGWIDLELLTELTSEEQLDALDLAGMLAVRGDTSSLEVRLAHPSYGEVLREEMPPLRGRRLRSRLATAIDGSDRASRNDRLRAARWHLETGGHADPEVLVDVAQLALLERDRETAGQIVSQLKQEAPSAQVTVLEAELLFRRGSHDEVEAVLAELDIDEIDADIRDQVIRRRAANIFWGSGQGGEAIAYLDDELSRSGRDRLSVRALWVALGVLAGNQGEVMSRAEQLLPDTDGLVRLEFLRAMALGRVIVGRPTDALAAAAEAHELAEAYAVPWSSHGIGNLEAGEIFANLEAGRMDAAKQAIDAMAPGAHMVNWVPIALAEVALAQGRPAVARERLEQVIHLCQTMGLDTAVHILRQPLMEAELLAGNVDTAAELVESVREFAELDEYLVNVRIRGSCALVGAAQGSPLESSRILLATAEQALGFGSLWVFLQHLAHAARLGSAADAQELLRRTGLDLDGPVHAARRQEIEARANDDGGLLATAAAGFELAGHRVCAARAYLDASSMLSGDAASDAANRGKLLQNVDGDLIHL